MKITSIAYLVFLSFFIGACDRDPNPSASHPVSSNNQRQSCDVESVEVINVALAGFGLEDYSIRPNREKDKIVVVWGGVRPPLVDCPNHDGIYFVIAPDQLPTGSLKPDVAVTSFFRSRNAAYVRATIYPMETNGEFFLSREAGKWVVVDKVVWKQ